VNDEEINHNGRMMKRLGRQREFFDFSVIHTSILPGYNNREGPFVSTVHKRFATRSASGALQCVSGNNAFWNGYQMIYGESDTWAAPNSSKAPTLAPAAGDRPATGHHRLRGIDDR
jgi:hypothetical protein